MFRVQEHRFCFSICRLELLFRHDVNEPIEESQVVQPRNAQNGRRIDEFG